jgi:CDP-diacylglycerol--glycerol-3-phosphate 3-phosphatidyltransferase
MNINFAIKELFFPSNILSIFRLLLTIPIFYLFSNFNEKGIKESIIILALFAGLTDILDGYLARKLNQITEIGKIIDPIADKILMAVFIIEMVHNELLPFYYLFLIIGRDILILFGGILITKLTGKVLASDYIGKTTVLVIGFVILITLLGVDKSSIIYNIIFFISIILILISLINYTIRAYKFSRYSK